MPNAKVVLTARGPTFSAGLDFDESLARFARRNREEVRAWFQEYRAMNLRLFAYNSPPNTSGQFFYGPTQTAVPFGNGYRCVTGSTFRLGPQQLDLRRIDLSELQAKRKDPDSHLLVIVGVASPIHGQHFERVLAGGL